jgi:hypothetical protein
MTTRTNPYAERDERANQLGWTYVSAQRCPRRLVDKHCRDVNCWCGTISAGETAGIRMRALNDHGPTWDHEGFRFVLWGLYGADGDLLLALIALARQDDVEVDICPSVWCPPYTVGIRFTEARRS